MVHANVLQRRVPAKARVNYEGEANRELSPPPCVRDELESFRIFRLFLELFSNKIKRLRRRFVTEFTIRIDVVPDKITHAHVRVYNTSASVRYTF